MSHQQTQGYYADSGNHYKSYTRQFVISGSLYIVAVTHNDQAFLTIDSSLWLVTLHSITDPDQATWHTLLPESGAMALLDSPLPGWLVDQVYALGG